LDLDRGRYTFAEEDINPQVSGYEDFIVRGSLSRRLSRTLSLVGEFMRVDRNGTAVVDIATGANRDYVENRYGLFLTYQPTQ
jgi:hypothetical protein